MRGVGIHDDVCIPGRPTLTAKTNSPVPRLAQIAVELTKEGARARLKMTAGQRGRNGRSIAASGRVEEDTGTVLVQTLVQLQRIHTDEPVQPALRVRSQPRFQALSGLISVLGVNVVVQINIHFGLNVKPAQAPFIGVSARLQKGLNPIHEESYLR